MQQLKEHPHRRRNPLTGEWVLVSPHRTARPWQGEGEERRAQSTQSHDPQCYLCPRNTRANGASNPDYRAPFSFVNDYSALYQHAQPFANDDPLFAAHSEQGVCKVLCYAPEHNLHLADFSIDYILQILALWASEYAKLSADPHIGHVQIFENRGSQMGASNPHPHGQVWAQESVPPLVEQKRQRQRAYYDLHDGILLLDYLQKEQQYQQRILYANTHFAWVMPFWACWPFETLILPLSARETLADMDTSERRALADALRVAIGSYDCVFDSPFPYSMGVHMPPSDDDTQPGWQFHIGFYPPLLRSASVRKFMVGYELCAMPQRDITPEQAAAILQGATARYRAERSPQQ